MRRLVFLSAILVSIFSVNLAQAGNKPWGYILDASKRFVVLPEFYDQAVLDRTTGLIWTKAPRDVAVDWPSAFEICLANAVGAVANGRGGIAGWRLPEAEELLSLTEFHIRCSSGNCGNSYDLPEGHPFDFQPAAGSDIFWSATLSHEKTFSDEDGSFVVNINGLGPVNAPRTEEFNVWCVRG